ncbi:MAG: hypothetical protein ACP5NP_05670 [Acetobacteraceae bacterium]
MACLALCAAMTGLRLPARAASLPPPGIAGPALPPGPDQRLIPGHWQWNGMRDIWQPSRTVPAEGFHHRWVRGHWRGRGERRVWVPGRWR